MILCRNQNRRKKRTKRRVKSKITMALPPRQSIYRQTYVGTLPVMYNQFTGQPVSTGHYNPPPDLRLQNQLKQAREKLQMTERVLERDSKPFERGYSELSGVQHDIRQRIYDIRESLNRSEIQQGSGKLSVSDLSASAERPLKSEINELRAKTGGGYRMVIDEGQSFASDDTTVF